MKQIFITGIAGMIGMHCALRFNELGWKVCGIDNFNDYYDPKLKLDREEKLNQKGIEVITGDIQNPDCYSEALQSSDAVLHLAAYANPRHSYEEPQHYIDTNITGTQRILELAEVNDTPVVYASSSCVMHGQPLPWNEHDLSHHQNNAYGWSKRVNECQFMYSRLSKTAGLRFFTVYGPWGRPDMALFLFADAIVKGTPLTLYNYGDMKRDFTYVEDIVQGVVLVTDDLITKEDDKSHEIYNIGYGNKVNLMDFVNHIETNFGRKGVYDMQPAHPADVPETWSDTSKIRKLGYNPKTPVGRGVYEFVAWYKDYYNVN